MNKYDWVDLIYEFTNSYNNVCFRHTYCRIKNIKSHIRIIKNIPGFLSFDPASETRINFIITQQKLELWKNMKC
jgi:hypothetical protein